MIPDRLFELAFLYKKTRLWKKLSDSHIFAVRFSDGEIGYCCVMGRLGELVALAVYPGQRGLDSLRKLHDDHSDDFLLSMECMHAQDCLMLSFGNKSDMLNRDWEYLAAYCRKSGARPRGKKANPCFERFRFGYERWHLADPVDQRRMAEALEAALEVARRLTDEMALPEALGIAEGPPCDRAVQLLTPAKSGGWLWEDHPLPDREIEVYPAIAIEDDLTPARLRRKKQGGRWAMRAFMMLEPVSMETEGMEKVAYEDLTDPPHFPFALLIVNRTDGKVLSVTISDNPQSYVETFARALIEAVEQRRLPREIGVEDARTEALMRDFCHQFGVALKREDLIPELDEAVDSLLEHAMSVDDDAMIDEVIDIMRDPELLREIPDDMLRDLFETVDPEVFPEDVALKLQREGIRRGILKV